MSAVDEITIENMIAVLIAYGCNLDDERVVIRALNNAGHASGDVLVFATEAAKRAKNFTTGENR
jgi:hypothetical protein